MPNSPLSRLWDVLGPALRALVRLVERWRHVPLTGTVTLQAGTSKPVDIVVDTWGIPHVHAATQVPLFVHRSPPERV